jgi:hypothetical protein
LEPDNFYALIGMAAIHAKKMQFSGCASYLDKASGISPDDADAILLTGILFLFDNSPFMAKQTFNELLKTGRNMDEAKAFIARFFP